MNNIKYYELLIDCLTIYHDILFCDSQCDLRRVGY